MTLAQLKYFVKVAQNGHLTQTVKPEERKKHGRSNKETGRRTWIFFV